VNTLKKLRLAVNYEKDVPRCETCSHVKKPYIMLTTDSQTRQTPWWCNQNKFTCAKNSVCDKWLGKDGSTL
jgi:hypothetical protein